MCGSVEVRFTMYGSVEVRFTMCGSVEVRPYNVWFSLK